MKKILVALVLSTILLGCRKGEEDPWISFHSRESRICGNWKVSEATETVGNHGFVYINGKINTSVGIHNYEGNYTWRMDINKDGTFSSHNSSLFPLYQNFEADEKGKWYFVYKNKSKENKNKTIIAFQVESATYNLDEIEVKGATTFFYDIVELSNKKIHLVANYESTSVVDSKTEKVRLCKDITLIPY